MRPKQRGQYERQKEQKAQRIAAKVAKAASDNVPDDQQPRPSGGQGPSRKCTRVQSTMMKWKKR